MEEKELDIIISNIINDEGGESEDYYNLMNQISFHETGGTLDPKTIQIGGGPGRGKYQFEIGENEGGKTAANRAIEYYKEKGIPLPTWLVKTKDSNSLDASTLTPEQQDILFLTNMKKHPKANFSNLWDGTESIEDFWANYHWAGGEKERVNRLRDFRESQEKLNLSSTNPIQNDPKQKNFTIDFLPEKEIDNTNTNKKNLYFDDRIKKSDKPNIDELNLDLFDYHIKDTNNYNNSVEPTIEQTERYTDWMRKYIQSNDFKSGGNINSIRQDTLINEFNTGGTHEENPLGGIPLGMGSNGKMNTVEEGETSFDFDDGKYIFSNRIKL